MPGNGLILFATQANNETKQWGYICQKTGVAQAGEAGAKCRRGEVLKMALVTSIAQNTLGVHILAVN